MKKILIGLMVLLTSVVFADTLSVVKGIALSDAFVVKYKNMKMSRALTVVSMKDNEYMTTDFGVYYKVNGKLYLTPMFELEFD